jgi:hypothetical protein
VRRSSQGSARLIASSLAILAVLTQGLADAGEIPGLPAALLPKNERDFVLNFSNDFLGRGGSVDDFRTQQINVTSKLGDKWLVVLDHSILTLKDSASAGRLDQLSASLGYQWLNNRTANGVDQVTFGGGVRGANDYAGERMQNGFHRLVGSETQSLPYVDTSSVDLTGWIEAQRYRQVRQFDNWTTGYWLRVGSLLTSDGQWDNVLSAMAVASRGSLDIWFGLRRDWRNGYDADNVQVETARAEDDAALAFGIRFGALALETVQQLNNDSSYGQLSFVSSGFRASNREFAEPRASIEFGILLPDVQVQLVGKLRTSLFVPETSVWRESVLLDLRYGEPQFGDNEFQYIHSQQLSAGMEWERSLSETARWVSVYGSVGAGWRNEQLNFSNDQSSTRSDTIGRAVLTAGAGLRFIAARLGRRWNYRIQLGLTAWAPLNDAGVILAGDLYSIQKPALAVVLGMSFDFSP